MYIGDGYLSKKLISAVLAFVLTISISFIIVLADPASDKAKIEETQVQKNDLENKIEMMDNQIETIMFKIKGNEINIKKTQKDILQSHLDMAKSENNIKTEQDIFGKRMRAMYMSGSSSYIDTILGSVDIDDFISRLENLKNIINFDQKILKDLNTKKSVIDLKKIVLDTENTKLLSLKVDNENKLADLTRQKLEQTVLITQLNTQESQYRAQLVTDQLAVKTSQIAIEKIRNSAPTNVSINADVFSSNSVLAYASNYIGVPYVWGGTTPSGFDCSGFTQYVFSHFRISLPRLSQDQQYIGTLVPRSNLQPGDLVFFGTLAHRVGIYVGNGNMINSPHTGAVIRIQALNSDFTYGRRVN